MAEKDNAVAEVGRLLGSAMRRSMAGDTNFGEFGYGMLGLMDWLMVGKGVRPQ